LRLCDFASKPKSKATKSVLIRVIRGKTKKKQSFQKISANYWNKKSVATISASVAKKSKATPKPLRLCDFARNKKSKAFKIRVIRVIRDKNKKAKLSKN